MRRYHPNPEADPQPNFDDPNAVRTLETYNYFSNAVQTGLLGDDLDAAYQQVFKYLRSQSYFLALTPANQIELLNFLRLKVSTKSLNLLTIQDLQTVLFKIHQVLDKIAVSDPDFLRSLFPHAQLDLYLMKKYPAVKHEDLDELRAKLEKEAQVYYHLPEYLWLKIAIESGQDNVPSLKTFLKSFLPELDELSTTILGRFIYNYLGLLYQSHNSYFFDYIQERNEKLRNARSGHFFISIFNVLEEYQQGIRYIPLPDSILANFLHDSYCSIFFTRTLIRKHREYTISTFYGMGLFEAIGHLTSLKLETQPETFWNPEYFETWLGVVAGTFHSSINFGSLFERNSDLPTVFQKTPILLQFIDELAQEKDVLPGDQITPGGTVDKNFKAAINLLLAGYLPEDLKLFPSDKWLWVYADGPSNIEGMSPETFRSLVPLTLESLAVSQAGLRAFTIMVFLLFHKGIPLDQLFQIDPRFWTSITICHCSHLKGPPHGYLDKLIEDPQKASCHQSGHHNVNSVLSRFQLLEGGADLNAIQAWLSEDVARRQKYHFIGFENYSFIDNDPDYPSTGHYLSGADAYYVVLAKLLKYLAVEQLSLLYGKSLEQVYALYWYLHTRNIDARSWQQLDFPVLPFFFTMFHDYYEPQQKSLTARDIERVHVLLDRSDVWSVLRTLKPIPRITCDAYAEEYGVDADRFYAEAKRKAGEPIPEYGPWNSVQASPPTDLYYLFPEITSETLLSGEVTSYKLLSDVLQLQAWLDKRYFGHPVPLTSAAIYEETFQYLWTTSGSRNDKLVMILVQQLFGEALFPQLDRYQASAVVKTLMTIYRKTRRGVFERLGGHQRQITEEEFPKHLRNFTSFVRSLPNTAFKKILDWIESLGLKKGFISEICRLVIVFGNNFKPWLDAVIKSNLAQKMGNRLHTGLIVLPYRSIPGLADYLIKYKNSLLSNNGYAILQALVGRWEDLTPEEQQRPPALIYRTLLQKSYPNAKDPEFAYEAAKVGIQKRAYAALERRWIASLLIPPPITSEDRPNGIVIPPIEYRGYRGYFLDRSDPRGLFLGSYTNCCQHPNGAGSAAAWYGQESPLAGYFVVEDKNGRIVAQSLYWIQIYGNLAITRKKYSALVFDNVESKGLPPIRNKIVAEIYERAAKAVLRKPLPQPGRYPSGLDIAKTLVIGVVNMGTGYGKLNYRKAKKAWSEKVLIDVPEDLDYTDAQNQVTITSVFKWA